MLPGTVPSDKKVRRPKISGPSMAVQVEGGEAAVRIQEIPHPQPQSPLRRFRGRWARSLRGGHDPPDIPGAVFQPPVMPEGEVVVAVRAYSRVVGFVMVH